MGFQDYKRDQKGGKLHTCSVYSFSKVSIFINRALLKQNRIVRVKSEKNIEKANGMLYCTTTHINILTYFFVNIWDDNYNVEQYFVINH